MGKLCKTIQDLYKKHPPVCVWSCWFWKSKFDKHLWRRYYQKIWVFWDFFDSFGLHDPIGPITFEERSGKKTQGCRLEQRPTNSPDEKCRSIPIIYQGVYKLIRVRADKEKTSKDKERGDELQEKINDWRDEQMILYWLVTKLKEFYLLGLGFRAKIRLRNQMENDSGQLTKLKWGWTVWRKRMLLTK